VVFQTNGEDSLKSIRKPDVGTTAPDFALNSAAGDTVTLSGLSGMRVVVFFVREFM
jgi:peroxiredoxin